MGNGIQIATDAPLVVKFATSKGRVDRVAGAVGPIRGNPIGGQYAPYR
eukprot:NODE_8191_length_225_cov_41.431818_g8108_i0.p1 GENE.NODE_8191_length_225_cov_41.431818_g8108_i0~~NODE_8191_length_225_cov_41.431818_g8108_i0.p1  ORF type:complete len:55 (+),score=18.08 NODE_8191_length_225_cov_41.431818_g8108_i0:22-165(+)